MSDTKYTRFIDFPEEVRVLIKAIWPEGDHPKPNVLVKYAGNKGISVEQYLINRINNPNMENGRMPKIYRERVAAMNKAKIPIKHTEETKAKMREAHTGKKISEEQRELMRQNNIGKKMSPEAIAKTVAANLGRKRTPQARANLAAAARLRSGENSPTWKGGVTPLNQKDRYCSKYQEWRSEVFRRDDYTCIKTGVKGGKLCAHHLWPFASNEDLRFSVFNGITLSDKAHREFHSQYGNNATAWQLEEWLGRELPLEVREELISQEGWDAYELQQSYYEYED